MQANCTNDPFCVNCNKVGHLSAMCALVSRAPDPYWAGFGGNQQGFFCCEVLEEEIQQPASNAALVIIQEGCLSAQEMEAEFKDLVDDN
jgi:hypothetical protein